MTLFGSPFDIVLSLMVLCNSVLGKTGKMITCFRSVAIICVEKLCILSFFHMVRGIYSFFRFLKRWIVFRNMVVFSS